MGDVPAMEGILEMDALHGLVGVFPGLHQIAAEGAYGQHAASGRDRSAIGVGTRTGMEHLDVRA